MTADQQIAHLDGAGIAYFDVASEAPDGRVILLIHGFASTAKVNWIDTGWADTLMEAGYRVVAMDNRGHGESSKFYSPEDYGPDIFAADALKLLDHLGVERPDIMGYSMGARITSYICHLEPERVRRAVLGGMGINIFGNPGGYDPVAEALESDDPDTVVDLRGKSFRQFADRVGADRLALAACLRTSQVKITQQIIESIETPVLVAVGTEDGIAGSPHDLAAMMPNAEGFDIKGLDHMKATGAATYKAKALEFLDG
ncbi:MAG: alpha/beta fold hydrolase [Rhizobiaceae bacterium]